MAQIPYSPIPNVTEQLAPTPLTHLNTPSDAFGGDIGQALSTLGHTTEEAGNEIFQRAIAMQQLNNESEAREASAKYMEQAGVLHADFTSRMGQNAGPAAFQKYTEDLNNTRTQIRSTLSNPMAQRMYDADSFSTMGRTIFNGAGHSADQMKGYALAANKAQIESANNAVLLNPLDERTFKANLDRVEANAMWDGHTRGLSDQDTANAIAEAHSTLWAARITGLARMSGQEAAAKALFDKAIENHDLRGETISKVEEVVNRSLMTSGAKIAADSIYDGSGMALGQKPVSLDRARDAIALGIESGGKYEITNPQSGALGRYQVMPNNLPGWLKQAGLPVMTPEKFLKNHDAQDQVFDKIFGDLMTKYGSFNEAASYWFSGHGMDGNTKSDGNATVPEYLKAVNAQLAKTATLEEKVAAGQGIAQKIAPGVPLMDDFVRQHVISRDNQDREIQRSDQQQRDATIDGALAQSKVSTIDDLRKVSPQVSSAIDQLNGKELLQLQQKLAIAAKNDNTITDERTSRFQQLRGMAYRDPSSFADLDLWQKDLAKDQRKDLLDMQNKVRQGKIIDDPDVKYVMNNPDIKLMLSKIIGAPADFKDEYNSFAGAVANEVNYFRSEGKTISYKQLEDIGNRLLQNETIGDVFTSWKIPRFEAAPPPEEHEAIRQLFIQGGRGEPTDEQIQRLFVHKLFMQSLGIKQTGSSAPPIPRSQ